MFTEDGKITVDEIAKYFNLSIEEWKELASTSHSFKKMSTYVKKVYKGNA